MRIFVTGATGFVGTAVVRELLRNGHSVAGLARSEASAKKLRNDGVDVIEGSLDDLDVLGSAAAEADAVIHLAFIHDFEHFEASDRADTRAIIAIGEALQGSAKPFLITGGTAGIASGRFVTEKDAVLPGTPRNSERMALNLADNGVHASIVRLPPSVHGEADTHGFIPTLISIAKEKGYSGYPGNGTNRWAAVNVGDAARAYVLAMEHAPAGSRIHVVGDESVTSKQIAEAIAKGLGIEAKSVPQDQIDSHFGWIGQFFALDIPASSDLTQELLHWKPEQPTLLEDLASGFYFK